MIYNTKMLERLCAFVLERQRIWYRRTVLHLQKPWTEDSILRQYKFCNVFREQDTVTQWIAEHIREPYAKHPCLWLMLAAARQINWPPTLERLMLTPRAFFNSDNWNAATMRATMLQIKREGGKLYTGAYMISGQRANPDHTKADKPHITCNLTLAPLWEQRKLLGKKLDGVTLQQAFEVFKDCNGFGGFMTGQVIADLKHTHYLEHARDWWTWCALGPGSARGLNRLYGRSRAEGTKGNPLNAAWSTVEAAEALLPVRAALRRAFKLETDRVLKDDRFFPQGDICMQDTQNCLCEFDKYERARLGQGRPRALYPGGV